MFPTYRPDTITRTNLAKNLTFTARTAEEIALRFLGYARARHVDRAAELLRRMARRGEAVCDGDMFSAVA